MTSGYSQGWHTAGTAKRGAQRSCQTHREKTWHHFPLKRHILPVPLAAETRDTERERGCFWRRGHLANRHNWRTNFLPSANEVKAHFPLSLNFITASFWQSPSSYEATIRWKHTQTSLKNKMNGTFLIALCFVKDKTWIQNVIYLICSPDVTQVRSPRFNRSVEFCLTPVELLVSLLFSGLVENEMSFLSDCWLRFYWCGFYRLVFVCWHTLSAFIISSFISGGFSSSLRSALINAALEYRAHKSIQLWACFIYNLFVTVMHVANSFLWKQRKRIRIIKELLA